MKFFKYSLPVAAAILIVGCDDIENQKLQGKGITEAQNKAVVAAVPSRANATFEGMFSMMGYPDYTFGAGRDDDFGYVMMSIANDVEGADVVYPNTGYNWFRTMGLYTNRNASFANVYIRFATPYNQIGIANQVIKTTTGSADSANVCKRAQALAVRAFAYEQVAFNYQFLSKLDEPCIPIVTENTSNYFNNPRATVREVYDLIFADLDTAIVNLEGYNRTKKAYVDQKVAYGLRARAHLALGHYAEAAADAEKAIAGYKPASIEDVSKPSFCDINEANWLWGIDMNASLAAKNNWATGDSWIRSFTSEGYTTGGGVYSRINTLLWDKIPASDIRKQWWVDEDLKSTLLEGLSWDEFKDQAIATAEIEDVKVAYDPYTNVKFGCISGVGSKTNDSDWPLMRVEEMIFIQAEGYLKSGNEAKAKEILGNFVKTYRDPEYDVNAFSNLADEIWKQRRIELWGEGFFTFDANRLHKPIVRFHDYKHGIQPDAFRFNLTADDPWRLSRFPQDETNNNSGIVDNTDGTVPVVDQNPSLLDGVTD